MDSATFNSADLRARNHGLFNTDDLSIMIVGCGAIGSFTASTFARMGVKSFYLYDSDVVAAENIGVQDFTIHQLGMTKVSAVRQNVRSINPTASFNWSTGDGLVKVDDRTIISDTNGFRDRRSHEGERSRRPNKYTVGIMCVDSMEARMEIAQNSIWQPSKVRQAHHDGGDYFFDVRMGSETLQLYKFKLPLDLDAYMKTWYSDEDGDTEPCAARSTAYCSTFAASIIASEVKKIISGGIAAETITFGFPALILSSETDYSVLTAK